MHNNSDELVFKLNAFQSTCAVEFYTVVDTSRSPVHNTPCPLHWVRDTRSLEITIGPGVSQTFNSAIHQASVVQRLDSAIRRIRLYPVDSPIGFSNPYPLKSDLSSG